MKEAPLTTQDIQQLRDIRALIRKLTFAYFNEYIKKDDTYHYEGFELNGNNSEIRIKYSHLCHDIEENWDWHVSEGRLVTIEELNYLI